MTKHTFVALGDSITYGFPYTPSISWVEHIRRETDWEVINAGISGETFDDMYSRLKRDVLAYKPDLVSIMGGTNDFRVGMSQPQVRRAFLSITDILIGQGIKVLVGLPLPVEDFIEGSLKLWRSWLVEYCREQNLDIIDFYQDFVDQTGSIREELLLDGCHPRTQGYEVMGIRAVETVKRLFS